MTYLSVSTGDFAQRTWHRVLVSGLATSAICFAILGWVGYWVPIYQHVKLSDRLQAYFYTSEGLARFYWLCGDDAFYLDTPNNFVNVRIHRSRDNSVWRQYRHARPNAIDTMAVVGLRAQQQQQGRRRRSAATGVVANRTAPAPPVRMYGFRTWISLPIALLAAYPVYVLSRASRQRFLQKKRRKAGHCERCGYDLTGLTEPRCPECGDVYGSGARGGSYPCAATGGADASASVTSVGRD